MEYNSINTNTDYKGENLALRRQIQDMRKDLDEAEHIVRALTTVVAKTATDSRASMRDVDWFRSRLEEYRYSLDDIRRIISRDKITIKQAKKEIMNILDRF